MLSFHRFKILVTVIKIAPVIAPIFFFPCGILNIFKTCMYYPFFYHANLLQYLTDQANFYRILHHHSFWRIVGKIATNKDRRGSTSIKYFRIPNQTKSYILSPVTTSCWFCNVTLKNSYCATIYIYNKRKCWHLSNFFFAYIYSGILV